MASRPFVNFIYISKTAVHVPVKKEKKHVTEFEPRASARLATDWRVNREDTLKDVSCQGLRRRSFNACPYQQHVYFWG